MRFRYGQSVSPDTELHGLAKSAGRGMHQDGQTCFSSGSGLAKSRARDLAEARLSLALQPAVLLPLTLEELAISKLADAQPLPLILYPIS